MFKIFKKKMRRCLQECNINYEELINKVQNGAILLDVRSIQEYNEGHLLNAIHLADYEIQLKYNNTLPNKNTLIIVYCQNGGRSKKAYKKLKKLGYKNVYNLCGGLDNIN
ncbi:MAG: rhodanese-like domain-containing protein [Clostridia bacterium]|nr:rhodanese-like domain-containing protein [Clostridia bacterium]